MLDSVEAGIMAASMLFAVGCFSRVLTTRGHDVELVMRGISSERGLAKLFSRLKGVQKGVRRRLGCFAAVDCASSSLFQFVLRGRYARSEMNTLLRACSAADESSAERVRASAFVRQICADVRICQQTLCSCHTRCIRCMPVIVA